MRFEKQIKINDIKTEDYRHLAEIIGIEKAIALTKIFGGDYVYVPKYESLTLRSRNNQIKKDFTGANIRELTRKYGLSSRSIRGIVC